MTVVVALTGLLGGFFAGWLCRSILVMAQISHAQERMQRKIRYWQSEAALARSVAEGLWSRLAVDGTLPWDCQDGPSSDSG